jgi:hypothetical protein
MYSCVIVFFFAVLSNVALAALPLNVVQVSSLSGTLLWHHAFLANISGIFGLIGRDLRDGLYAAFNESNLNGGIRSVVLTRSFTALCTHLAEGE